MANFYGAGRSNYVEVKDKDKFEEFCEQFGCLTVEDKTVNGREHYCILAENDDGSFPTHDMDDCDIDFMGLIAKHLKEDDDNIFIWMSAGNEKMRHVVGYAVAVNHKGEECYLHLDNIYDMCLDQLGSRARTQASY